MGSWACPDIEVFGLDGGFDYVYDEATYPGGPPLDTCGVPDVVAATMGVEPMAMGAMSVEPVPTSADTKATILDWLAGQGVTGVSGLTKAELLDLVQDLLD